jgi:hypothetical protein
MLAGCNRPAETTTVPLSGSHFDLAIENLSITTEQLESVRKEKDLFVNVPEDFEEQKAADGPFLNANQFRSQMQDFADWHRDISQRERQLEVRHALNVFAAHSQVAKRRFADPNQTMLANPAPATP